MLPIFESIAKGAEHAHGKEKEGLLGLVRQYAQWMESEGIRPLETVGKPFDPHFHEALFEIPNAEVPNSTVLQVLSQGYTLNERILRPARVGVSRGGPKAAPAAAPQADAQARARASAEAYEQPSEAAGGTAAGRRVDEQL
jgi:molecular chaperone GrpE